MANPPHPTNSVDSSRYPRIPDPFANTGGVLGDQGVPQQEILPETPLPEDAASGEQRGMPPHRIVSARAASTHGEAYAYGGGSNEGHSETFGKIDEFASGPSLGAARRQPRASDDVHYTTSPFEAPRSEPDKSGAPIDPEEKRGLASRAAGTVMLAASALFGVAALALTVLMQVYIAVPLFLVAGGLFYAGKGSLRDSSEKINEPENPDPGRRRQPDIGD